MKINNKKTGYSTTTANNYINQGKPIYCLSTELEKQYKFEDKRPTKEISAYICWFSQEGLPPISVKFNTEISLPPYLSVIEFENLQACEVHYNVYFKADSVKQVK
ncbi:TPA: hypothetical protein ACF9FI_001787 [Streptococcus suis]